MQVREMPGAAAQAAPRQDAVSFKAQRLPLLPISFRRDRL
jgi:hypothetical protein